MDKTATSPGIFEQLVADKTVAFTILVAAFGYFVDVFDLLLFNILRIPSLKSLGVPEADLLSSGVYLLNMQMSGLLLGGFLWGVAGDKFGRLSVLFGSIILYSAGNIANYFVQTVDQYAALRFFTGIGLAGELGVGVTLASELLPKKLRGLGTTFIATIGVLGATAAAIIANHVGWREAYLIGGLIGLVLLALRMGVRESGMYKKCEDMGKKVKRGSILMFFKNLDLFRRYAAVLLIGAPTWCVVGIFITFTPEFAKDFGMPDLPTAGNAVLYCYMGLAVGDLLSGVMSQYLKSRRRSIAISLVFLIAAMLAFTSLKPQTLEAYYAFCFLLGIGAGYWAMFVQIGAEQFGTNLRSTAATSVPNVARGLAIPITLGFRALIPAFGVTGGGLAVFSMVMLLAFLGLYLVKETFHDDLDYVEEHKH